MIKKKEQILEGEIEETEHDSSVKDKGLRVGSVINSKLIDYVIKPFLSGLLGFAFFLIVVVGTEFLAFVLNNQDSFKIDEGEFILSSVGFICFFLIAIVKKSKA